MRTRRQKAAAGAGAAAAVTAGAGAGAVGAQALAPAGEAASRKFVTASFLAATVMFAALLAAIAVPGKVTPRTSVPFYVAAALMEALFLWRYVAGGKKRSTCHIAIVVWVLLIVWEVASTDLKLTHPVLIPIPENVFAVFPKLYDELLLNVASSMALLAQGFITALVAGYLIGLFVGWVPQLREAVYPIAHVLAPVPAIVFAPYLVMLLPSFKMAAIAVIFLGIFWPTLLSTILRVESMDHRIVESARMLGLSTPEMIFQVLLPFMYPAIAQGLKTQLPSAMLMLVMAEMYGATSGLGYFVINYTNYANYTNVVAGIIMVGVVVTVLDGLVSLLVRKTVKWSE
ncbi:ABC transporter permease [Adlercreutzia sp. ZJ242]|uniref:ABC transporter permease n=1 Tax=Adlercreutzia sp. ZJ242 TaxID=2709409 RepID=UPI0013EA3B01|nr:ABC transporter permease subunit [Adlercreutzia sp. ZJ242]